MTKTKQLPKKVYDTVENFGGFSSKSLNVEKTLDAILSYLEEEGEEPFVEQNQIGGVDFPLSTTDFNVKYETEWQARERVGEKPFEKQDWEEEFDADFKFDGVTYKGNRHWKENVKQSVVKGYIRRLLSTTKQNVLREVEKWIEMHLLVRTPIGGNGGEPTEEEEERKVVKHAENCSFWMNPSNCSCKTTPKEQSWEEERPENLKEILRVYLARTENVNEFGLYEALSRLLSTTKQNVLREILAEVQKLPVSIEKDVWGKTYYTVKNESVYALLTHLKEEKI